MECTGESVCVASPPPPLPRWAPHRHRHTHTHIHTHTNTYTFSRALNLCVCVYVCTHRSPTANRQHHRSLWPERQAPRVIIMIITILHERGIDFGGNLTPDVRIQEYLLSVGECVCGGGGNVVNQFPSAWLFLSFKKCTDFLQPNFYQLYCSQRIIVQIEYNFTNKMGNFTQFLFSN